MPETNSKELRQFAPPVLSKTAGIAATAITLLLGLDVMLAKSVQANEPTQPINAIVNDRPISARVLGGANADLNDWPSIVPLIETFRSGTLGDRLFCGGSVVAERWVMTAAHCLYGPFGQVMDANSISVVTGVSDLNQSDTPTEYRVLRHYIHPDYDNSEALPPNDIALLEFSEDLNAPAMVLFAGESDDFNQSLGFIAGWGATRFENDEASDFPTLLQDATVPVVSNAVCNSPESYDGLIQPTHMCAGFVEGLVDACAGDSGGPLTISVDGQQQQAGITSFGTGCGLPNFYGIYTNVSHYLPWMSQYFTVPEQSQALIDARAQAAAQGGQNSTESLGGINLGLLALLLGYLPVLRGSFRAGQRNK